MVTLGLLPLLALFLAVIFFFPQVRDVSAAIIIGALSWCFAVALGTEVLSLTSAISFGPLVSAWILANVALLLALATRLVPKNIAATGPGSVGMAALASFLHQFLGSSVFVRRIHVVLIAFAALTLLTALAYPPNTWDSHTVYLARMEHWIQNRTFSFYPTSIERQLEWSPFQGIVLLQFHVLTGSDRLDGLIQWLAGVGSVLVTGRISRTFGVSQERVALTRLITAMLPIGLAESTGTQADLILTFFLLCTAERLLAWRKSERLRDAALMSIAAGLALSTKNTAYLIGFPFGVWFLAAVTQKERKRILSILFCAVLVLLPNASSYLRNTAYSGGPLGDTGLVNSTTDWGVGPFVLNAVRNAAVHFATPLRGVNSLFTTALVKSLAFVGLDADDPHVTYAVAGPFRLSTDSTGEENAPNPIHALLCVTATIFFLLGRTSADTAPRYYALCITAAVSAFLILLKWNPWVTRWHLPLFALAIPLVGTMPIFRTGSKTRAGLAVALILLALPVLLANRTRPLLPVPGFPVQFWSTDEEKVFARDPGKLPQFQLVMGYILRHQISQIGLILNYDDWEYPYWRYLREAGVKNLRIEHVGLSGRAASVPYPLGPFSPEAIISVGQSLPAELSLNHQSFRKELESSRTTLYLSNTKLTDKM